MEERGQVLPLVALLVLLVGAASLVLGRLGAAAVARAQAVTAADAAALAGAAAGKQAARAAAEANGARLGRYQEAGLDTTVEVWRKGARASARARRRPAVTSGSGLAPGLRAALARAEQLMNRSVPTGRPVNADPGLGRHRAGLAVDVPERMVAALVSVAPRAGLCQPYPDAHPVHFEVCPHGVP